MYTEKIKLKRKVINDYVNLVGGKNIHERFTYLRNIRNEQIENLKQEVEFLNELEYKLKNYSNYED